MSVCNRQKLKINTNCRICCRKAIYRVKVKILRRKTSKRGGKRCEVMQDKQIISCVYIRRYNIRIIVGRMAGQHFFPLKLAPHVRTGWRHVAALRDLAVSEARVARRRRFYYIKPGISCPVAGDRLYMARGRERRGGSREWAKGEEIDDQHLKCYRTCVIILKKH